MVMMSSSLCTTSKRRLGSTKSSPSSTALQKPAPPASSRVSRLPRSGARGLWISMDARLPAQPGPPPPASWRPTRRLRCRGTDSRPPGVRTPRDLYPAGSSCVSSALLCIRSVDSLEHGALELAAEAIHVDLIPQLTAHHAAPATTTDLFKAGLLVCCDARRVELEDRQHDIMETEGDKSIVEHQARRLCTVALTPAFWLADHDAERGSAIAVVHAVHPRVADGPQSLPFVDRERRVVVRLRLPVVPFLLLFARHRERWEPERTHGAKVVDPALINWQ